MDAEVSLPESDSSEDDGMVGLSHSDNDAHEISGLYSKRYPCFDFHILAKIVTHSGIMSHICATLLENLMQCLYFVHTVYR